MKDNKMGLTKKEYIVECQKLWSEIKTSGKSKRDFLLTPEGKVWLDKEYMDDCPLCEYDNKQFPQGKVYHFCSRCPLEKKYDKGCSDLGYNPYLPPTEEWLEAINGL